MFTNKEYFDLIEGMDFAEIAITSNITMSLEPSPSKAFFLEDVEGIGVQFGEAKGTKCERCYKVLPEVGEISDHETLCIRCADAVIQYLEKMV